MDICGEPLHIYIHVQVLLSVIMWKKRVKHDQRKVLLAVSFSLREWVPPPFLKRRIFSPQCLSWSCPHYWQLTSSTRDFLAVTDYPGSSFASSWLTQGKWPHFVLLRHLVRQYDLGRGERDASQRVTLSSRLCWMTWILHFKIISVILFI